MVHRRSIEKRIEKKHTYLIRSLSFYDRWERETICTQEAVVPCLELVEKEFGKQYTMHSIINFEPGEILKDSHGRGTLQK